MLNSEPGRKPFPSRFWQGLVFSREVSLGLCLARLEPAHMRQLPFYPAPYRNQLRGDGHRDLFRSDRSDIETDGCVNPVKQVRRNSIPRQLPEYLDRLALS